MSANATGLFGKISERLFAPAPVYAAVWWRMVLAIWTFLFIVPRLPYLTELYTPAPIMERSATMTLLHVPVLPIWAVSVLFVILLFAAVGFACGVHARSLHVVIFLIMVYLMGFDRWAIRGFGELGLYQWAWLFFMPYDRLWDEKGRVVKAPMWGLYLAWFQITAVYLSTFTGKWLAPGRPWLSGEALYNALHSSQYGFVGEYIDVPFPLARVMGWIVLATEGLVPLAYWNRRTRPYALLGMVPLHLGAGLTMRVTILFQFLLLAHAPLFFSNATWERLYFFLGITDAKGERRRKERP